MKPLADFNSVEKAKLLHELFPDEIQQVVAYVEECTKVFTDKPDQVKDNWGDNIFSADAWIALAKEVQGRIKRNRKEMIKGSRRFADQLFDGYAAMFTTHCLGNYLMRTKNSRFKKAIELLFDL